MYSAYVIVWLNERETVKYLLGKHHYKKDAIRAGQIAANAPKYGGGNQYSIKGRWTKRP